MLPTPSTSHVPYTTVYEPAEDSFLLLDALSAPSETAWLQSRLGSTEKTREAVNSTAVPTPSLLISEIGTGSGVVIAFATAHARAIFGRDDVLAVGVDVNGNACRATAETVRRAVGEFKSAATDGSTSRHRAAYLGSLCDDLGVTLRSNEVDVLMFNPPYVPTEELPGIPHGDIVTVGKKRDFETESHLLALSYAGGKQGMETTDRWIANLRGILSQRGVAYLLLCAANKPEEVKGRIRNWGDGWQAETIRQSGKQAGWEKLDILRIWRDSLRS